MNKLWYRAFVLDRGWLKPLGKRAPEGEPKSFCPWFWETVAAVFVYGLLYKIVLGSILEACLFVAGLILVIGRAARTVAKFLWSFVPPAKFWQTFAGIVVTAGFIGWVYLVTDVSWHKTLQTPPVLAPHPLDIAAERTRALEEWDLEYQLRDWLSVQLYSRDDRDSFHFSRRAYTRWLRQNGHPDYWLPSDDRGFKARDAWARAWNRAWAWALVEYPPPAPEPTVLRVEAVKKPFVDMEKLIDFPGKATTAVAEFGIHVGQFLTVLVFWVLVVVIALVLIVFSVSGLVKGVRKGWEAILVMFVFTVWIWDWPVGRAVNWLLKFVLETIPRAARSFWQQTKFLVSGLLTRYHDKLCPPLEWEGEWNTREGK